MTITLEQSPVGADDSAVSRTSSPAAETSEGVIARPSTDAPGGQRRRIAGLDVARGLAIVLMLLVMNPGNTIDLPTQLHHADWNGFTLADLAFPLFLFVAGVSMTLSPRGLDTRQVLRRCTILFVLGVGLSTFKDGELGLAGVLQHTAGAYLVAFGVLRAPRRWQLRLAVGIAVAQWAGFVLWAAGGDPWGQSGTLAHRLDGLLLGGFHPEGTAQTLAGSVTVLGGAFAGYLIRGTVDRGDLVRRLAQRAVGLTALGLALANVVPINKRLWTPSYSVLTIGLSLGVLAVAIWLVDGRGFPRLTAPLVHLGSNPIAVYVGFMVLLAALRNYGGTLTPELALVGSAMAGALVYAFGWVILWWLFALALHRRHIFLKV